MSWSTVGNWIKNNAGRGAALVGSLLTGNVPGAIAAGVSMISSATGTDDPTQALEALQTDPAALVKLKELYYANEVSVRNHIAEMKRLELEDAQSAHEQQQQTIRAGDASGDERIRLTRPTMAKQSWTATIAYCIGCFGVLSLTGDDVFALEIAGILSAPAWAYMGFRTGDKMADAWKQRGKK